MPASSSKVMTKSTSLRTDSREASSFLAAQGPMNTTRACGDFCLIFLAVATMGVSACETSSINCGNCFFASMAPGGTARSQKEGQLSGNDFLHVMMRLGGSADVGAAGHLVHFLKADIFQGALDLGEGNVLPELPHDGGRHLRHDIVALFNLP